MLRRSYTGALTWNANGSLGKFVWTDGNDSTKSQTCTYSSDALNRLASTNCLAPNNTIVWNQTFTYDAFGNIDKAANGGTTYNAKYSPGTNQVLSGVTAAYDGNGNQTQTTLSALTWDAMHNAISAGGSNTMTYDVLGRLVEYNGNHQVIYGPTGEKLAVYSGGGSVASVALPGGGDALYTSGSLTAIRRKDWLGSSRLATTWSGGVYSKTAFSPFGEAYGTSGATDLNFTGQTQDSVPSLYDFPARKFDTIAGRWIKPDPGSWKVVDPKNPQSFNRYAYVRNNPLFMIDPNGLDCVYVDTGSNTSFVDSNSSAEECSGSEGTWVPGTVDPNNVFFNGQSNLWQVASTDGGMVDFASFSEGAVTNANGACVQGDCAGADIESMASSWLVSQFVGG